MKKMITFLLLGISISGFSRVLDGDYYEDFRIKNPRNCPEKIDLTYYSDKRLDLFIPKKDHGTFVSGDGLTFEDDTNKDAIISPDNLYGAMASLKIYRGLNKRGFHKGLVEEHMLRAMGDGLVWQTKKGLDTRTCIYLNYQTPEDSE